MTKAELLKLLEPYGPDEPVVFVTFGGGIAVHERVEVAKDHCTTRTAPDGRVHMPVAIYIVGEGRRGRPGVLGLGPKDILGLLGPAPAGGEAVLQLALVVRRSTLAALSEHSASPVPLAGAIDLNESEVLVLLEGSTVRRLLDAARPGDTRIDDVIMRLAL